MSSHAYLVGGPGLRRILIISCGSLMVVHTPTSSEALVRDAIVKHLLTLDGCSHAYLSDALVRDAIVIHVDSDAELS